MNIDPIINGIVIDHITAGNGMKIFDLLHLNELEIPVVMIKNVPSRKMGRKDIIKIEGEISLDLDVVGYIDPDATVNIIREGKTVEKKKLDLPEVLTDVLFCQNSRCITSTEQELRHVFRLSDRENKVYRCIYCETKA